MIDVNSNAAKNFYREVRAFAQRMQPWETAIFYETKPDEEWDITLISLRVYGRRGEYLAVMAAGGLDAVDRPMTQRQLVLPTEGQLYAIKRRTGFESRDDYREERAPTWERA